MSAAIVVVAAAVSATAGDREPDGAAAPPNTWLMDGGCASRSCQSLTQPVIGDVEKAWEQTFPGEVDGDPLA